MTNNDKTTPETAGNAPAQGPRPGISAFFPAYNDAGTIASMILAALHTCSILTDDYEVIVINDGSSDYTGEVLAELGYSREQIAELRKKKVVGSFGPTLEKRDIARAS